MVCVCVCVCVCVYIMEYYSMTKKNEILQQHDNMDGTRVYYAKLISQSEKDKYLMTSLICVI